MSLALIHQSADEEGRELKWVMLLLDLPLALLLSGRLSSGEV